MAVNLISMLNPISLKSTHRHIQYGYVCQSLEGIMKKSVSFFIVTLFLFMAFCELSQVNPQKAIASETPKHQLSITITNPSTQNQTILTNFITINGTTSDHGAR